jgi:2-polyprenyl-3-methyl-5-hydroxy-6-metoxy-1,4-benzoquinol methylase
MSGGYDDGYSSCPCFWGNKPSSLVIKLAAKIRKFSDFRVLDAGCGEGKNAAFFAKKGARVDAIDVSKYALNNAARAWPARLGITWIEADLRRHQLPSGIYDIVVAYGLLHCLASREEVAALAARLKATTRPGGHFALCAFNNRAQDLRAHPNFSPTLLSHTEYCALFWDWNTEHATDTDLTEQHPHNNIVHTHSITRILAHRPMEQP